MDYVVALEPRYAGPLVVYPLSRELKRKATTAASASESGAII